MAQGKLKVKKLPAGVKSKKKGLAVTKRTNAPVKPKSQAVRNNKMKNVVSKMVNKKAEAEIRSLATEGARPLSKGQEAAVKHTRRARHLAT